MASKDITISSWNIASLRQRILDLKNKIDSGNIDVIFSQECRIANDNRIPKLNSYVQYRLSTLNSCVIYVKNTLPLPLLHHQSKHRGTQSHGIRVHVGTSSFSIINSYARANLLGFKELPRCIQSESTVMVGDLLPGTLDFMIL